MCKKYIVTVLGIMFIFALSAYRPCRDVEQHSYRMYNGQRYMILDTAGFYLYSRYAEEEPVKGKELVRVKAYYFSAGPQKPIEPLRIEELKQAFPSNIRFHYLLDENFRNDGELIAFDPYQNVYKLKYLYFLTAN
jgi:hypothetical protein